MFRIRIFPTPPNSLARNDGGHHCGGKKGEELLGSSTILHDILPTNPPFSSSHQPLHKPPCPCMCVCVYRYITYEFLHLMCVCVCVCLIFSSNFLLPGKKVGGYLTQFLHLSLKEFPPSLTTPPPLRPAKAKKPPKKIRKRREI